MQNFFVRIKGNKNCEGKEQKKNTGWAISRLTLVRDLNAFLSSDL
jgi:hypothetical protein